MGEKIIHGLQTELFFLKIKWLKLVRFKFCQSFIIYKGIQEIFCTRDAIFFCKVSLLLFSKTTREYGYAGIKYIIKAVIIINTPISGFIYISPFIFLRDQTYADGRGKRPSGLFQNILHVYFWGQKIIISTLCQSLKAHFVKVHFESLGYPKKEYVLYWLKWWKNKMNDPIN